VGRRREPRRPPEISRSHAPHTLIVMATTGAAFFDLDKTLMEGSSAFHFGRAAYRAGMMTRGQILRDAWENVKFRLNGSTDEGIDALRTRVLDAIAGHRRVDLARLNPEVLSGILPRVYPDMLKEAWGHQDAGRPAYIVTAASQEMADMLAHVLILDGGIGFLSELDDDVYTGRAAGPFTYREGKAQAMRELAGREGIALEDSYAYSDSESDLPMLRAVGHPVAVNPDSELERVARSEGWRVMRFDPLRRRLQLGLAALALGGLAAGGGALVSARARRPRWRPPFAR
jgi:HAD superfamily hydrolase (TIGR01490 family)